MGKVTVVSNISLDGVMQSPARPDEDTRGGFSRGGWAAEFQDEVLGRKMGTMMANSRGAMLFGRRTYEDLHSVWAGRTGNPYSKVLDNTRKYVASRTLSEPLVWQNSTLLSGDAADAVAELKRTEEGDLGILGSGDLIASLVRRRLVDVFVLVIYPIVLGAGRKLFPENAEVRLRLAESITTPKGVIIATYHLE